MQKGKNTFRTISIGVIIGIVILVLLGACVKHNGKNSNMNPNDDEVNSHLIAYWGKEGTVQIPIFKPDEFKKWLEKNGIIILQFIKNDGKVFVSNIKGEEVEPCGWVIDGQIIPNDCKKLRNIAIENLAEEITLGTVGSPGCVTRKIGGYLVQVCP